MQTEDNTSKTDVPVGQGFRYPPQVFTDPRYAATVPHMEEEEEEQAGKSKFLGRYCEFCDKCSEKYCWCNSSDWEEGLLDVNKTKFKSFYRENPITQKTPYRMGCTKM